MKKLLIVVLFILLSAWPAFSQTAVLSSGLTTSDWAVVTSSCLLYGVERITNAASDASVIVYDSASAASGTIAFKGTVSAANNFGGAMFPNPVEMFNGIYVDVSGTGAAYIIYWRKR